MNDELEKESSMRVSLVVSLCRKDGKKTPQKEVHLHLIFHQTKIYLSQNFKKRRYDERGNYSFSKQIFQFGSKGSPFLMASSGQASGIVVQLNGLVNGDGNFHFNFFISSISC